MKQQISKDSRKYSNQTIFLLFSSSSVVLIYDVPIVCNVQLVRLYTTVGCCNGVVENESNEETAFTGDGSFRCGGKEFTLLVGPATLLLVHVVVT